MRATSAWRLFGASSPDDARIGRQDHGKPNVTDSDEPYGWEDGLAPHEPRLPLASVRIGKCGSRPELPEGRPRLTRGVGPMHRERIGAALPGKEDRAKVLRPPARVAAASRASGPRRARPERRVYMRRHAQR